MLMKFLILFFISFSVFSSQITIKNSVINVNEIFSLSELTSTKLNSDNIKSSLMKLDFSRFNNKWLSKEELESVLSAQIGEGVQIVGPSKFWINICYRLDEKTLRSIYIEKFKKLYQENNVQLERMEIVKGSDCLNERYTHFVVSDNSLLSKRQRITAFSEQGKSRSFWVKLQYRLLLPFSSNSFIKNERVINKDVEWKYTSSRGIDYKDLYLSKLPLKLLALLNISSNELIDKNNTYIRPAISKGDFVKVILNHGNIKIDAKAKALGTGYVGDTMQVLIENMKKSIKAKVVAEGVVSV